MRYQRKQNERGVALVTVLMIVAAMSTVAVMLSSAVLSSTNRARALDAGAQADWFATGAEQFAGTALEELLSATGAALFADMPLLTQPISFNVEGGRLALTVEDASNCFNLNTLSNARHDGEEVTAQSPSTDFLNLLEYAELEGIDSERLASALIDWMDPDQAPGLGGAEDSYYRSLTPPYRTAGQPFANLTELYAVRHVTPELVDKLRPLVCVHETVGFNALNINTLTEAEAPMLALAMSGALRVDTARDVIFQRPPGGWESVGEMMELPEMAQVAPDRRRMDMLSVNSSHIGVTAVIEYRGLRRTYEILYALDKSGGVHAVRKERKG
ncbi:type II secretion system minor pseudopilin GspK [Henriciella sp.]|uniref:type II secretion system minor pseudopilin GspK n=1 Tax=Henriciella sp. TaxID=1968823 RepID=UPI0026112A88|nr:type II secretion system minor pseudopilin GspK [Henriciella sp.]